MTEPQWKPVVYLPVNLTVEFDAPVLIAGDPAPWCQQKAAQVLGPEASRKKVRQLAECLEEYANNFRAEPLPAHAALFFYPDFFHIPPRAMAKVFIVGPDPVTGPMTPARAREVYGPDNYSFGETEMTETDVPAGPALRVHRFRKDNPDKRRSAIIEELAWVIFPPNSTQAAMISVKWVEPAFSKAGITIADNMARNFRIDFPGLEQER